MKRSATTSSVNKKGRFLSIFVFVSFLISMTVSSLISNSVSAASPWDNLIKSTAPLPVVTLDQKTLNSCSGNYNLSHVSNLSDLIKLTNANVPSTKNSLDQIRQLPFDFDSDRWIIGSRILPDWQQYRACNPSSETRLIYGSKDLVFKTFTAYNGRPYWGLHNPTSNSLSYKIFRFIPSGFVDPIASKYLPHNGINFVYTEAHTLPPKGVAEVSLNHIFINNFTIEYPDTYNGSKFISEYTALSSFTPVLSGYIHGQQLYAIVEKDNIMNDFDYFFNQKYQYKLYLFNNQDSYDLIDTKILSFSDPYKYNFSANSSNGLYKVEVLPILQPPFTIKYDFKSAFIPLEYKGFSTNTYFSTKNVPFGTSKPEFVFENCDNIDVPCHLRNIITSIRKFFYDIFQMFKAFIIPDFDSIKSVIESAQLQARENMGAISSLFDFIRISFGSFVDAIFPTLFIDSYMPPCDIFPQFNFFGSSAKINICKFEQTMGTFNFNKIRFLISGVFIFSSMSIFRSLFIKFFAMLGDAQS